MEKKAPANIKTRRIYVPELQEVREGGTGYNGASYQTRAMLRVWQCLIWVKNSLVMGRQDFQWKHEPCLYGESEIEEEAHEPCLYGWTEGKKHYFFKNRRQTTVLNFDKPVKSAEHPTMKPIKLFDYQMQCSSKQGENVLDLFAGSGTTIMAAEQNGRNAYCMEFDPKYCDVILQRYINFNGTSDGVYRLNADGTKTKYEELT